MKTKNYLEQIITNTTKKEILKLRQSYSENCGLDNYLYKVLKSYLEN